MKAIGPHEMMMAVRVVAGGGMLYSAVFILRAVRKRMYSDSNSDISQALDKIWERYNRGEISWDEYEVLSRDLEGYRR